MILTGNLCAKDSEFFSKNYFLGRQWQGYSLFYILFSFRIMAEVCFTGLYADGRKSGTGVVPESLDMGRWIDISFFMDNNEPPTVSVVWLFDGPVSDIVVGMLFVRS